MPKLPKTHGTLQELMRHQIAALPFRESAGKLEVCLVTTRETGRWTLPKGWPMKKLKDHASARVEAEQEAGVSGDIYKTSVGTFRYFKRLVDRFELVMVTVYPLPVTKFLATWKEQAARQVQWTSFEDAAEAVEEPELRTLLQEIARKPEILRKSEIPHNKAQRT